MQASVISEKIPEKDSAPPEKDEKIFTPTAEVFMELWRLEKENEKILSEDDKTRITKDVLVKALSLRYSKRKVMDLIDELISKEYCSCKEKIVVTTWEGKEAHRRLYVQWEEQNQKRKWGCKF